MKKKYFLIILIILFTISLEMLLRFKYGFCDTVLIKEDPNFEYIAQPNQNRHRFGNNVFYNQFSMRSKPIIIPNDSLIVLGFGDSVINLFRKTVGLLEHNTY